ncbi:MAG: TIGR03435 family protein [Bryobacteraceae bacterium]
MRPGLRQTCLWILACSAALGQTVGGHPSFEVASVKPLAEFPRMVPGGPEIRYGCFGGPGSSAPGRFWCNATSLRQLVVSAYHLKPYQLTLPAWMGLTYYDIAARIPAGSTAEQFRFMQQNLLAERFKMTVHFDKKEVPVYELKVAKGGPKCKETTTEPPSEDRDVIGEYLEEGGRVRHTAKQTMEELAAYLTIRLRQPVFDATGLTATYDIVLNFVQEPSDRGLPWGAAASSDGGVGPASDPAGGPTLIGAVQSQLGLKLEAKKGTIDVLVIDHAEKVPTEN